MLLYHRTVLYVFYYYVLIVRTNKRHKTYFLPRIHAPNLKMAPLENLSTSYWVLFLPVQLMRSCFCPQLHGGWTARSRQKPGRAPWRGTATLSSTCRLTSPAADTSPASSRSDPRTKTHLPQTRQYITYMSASILADV